MIRLPRVFEEVLADVFNPLVSEAVAEGRRALGYTCSYVPEPLIALDGLVPVRLRAPGVHGTPLADTYLSSVLCSYSRSLLEQALEGRCDFLAGWVFTASCDHGRRLYDNVAYLLRPSFNHLLDVPHKIGEAQVTWFTEELGRLAAALTTHFGVDTSAAALKRAITRHGDYLAPLRELSALRKKRHPPISGAAFHTLVTACQVAPRDRLAAALSEVCEALRGAPGISDYRARLMVVGSQLDDPAWIALVESQGALVVADRFCVGSLPGLEPLEAKKNAQTGAASSAADDPLHRLATHTLRRTRCPRMMDDFEARLADIVAAARDYEAQGVILETLKFCDLWGVESAALAEALRQAGLPVLRLEREYAPSGEGQLRTRVQAFLESLEGRAQ